MTTEKPIRTSGELERQALHRERVEVIPATSPHIDAGRGAGDFLAHIGNSRGNDLIEAVEMASPSAVDHDDSADVHVGRSTVKEKRERCKSASPWQSVMVRVLRRSSYSCW